MTDPVLLSQAHVTELEEEYVLRALRSGWVAPLGPEVDAFEAEVAERVGGGVQALALSSGTAALHLALEGLGARPGTCVVLPSMTFAASANAVAYTGAEPVFVDSGDDANVSPSLLLEAVDSLRAKGREVAAVMTVDLFGRACDYTRIAPALAERGVALVEDAAEALGATTPEGAAGSFGRVAALSFNGNKVMTTSGGGMLLSNDAELLNRARYLSTQARRPFPWYEHTEIGYNYRLSNILAALGRAQLARLDGMIARRRQIRDHYAGVVAGHDDIRILGRESTKPPAGTGSGADARDNCWLTCLVIGGSDGAGTGRPHPDELVRRFGEEGIEVRHLWKPMHLQPVFADATALLDGTSERLFATGITLPSGSALTDSQVERVGALLRTVLEESL
ncbi:aminotransferase class I/II-fold pyridoxal phosphate-dependent enzyme [Mobilicoccus sp.]|uniref:DegT/DnrJ/EryC1/StrS family aminotransferase n=1 Tax=Mobilicoccus sp. TaxID=2034349 RepID=UPI0028A72949|nr:aminotransferase class I/II-fold pyridoxal phosphate-dependent enzyme [Mobilicoccus sp.]